MNFSVHFPVFLMICTPYVLDILIRNRILKIKIITSPFFSEWSIREENEVNWLKLHFRVLKVEYQCVSGVDFFAFFKDNGDSGTI